jgi:hypothetical protein
MVVTADEEANHACAAALDPIRYSEIDPEELN